MTLCFGQKTKEYEYLHDERFVESKMMPLIKKIIGKNKRILDVGTRSGFWLCYYCEGTGNIGVGADIEQAKRIVHSSVTYVDEPVDVTFKLPFERKSFDVATMTEVLEHLWVPGDKYAVENLIEVAREKVIISVPRYVDRPWDSDRGRGNQEHINLFDCQRFDSFLSSFGHKYEHIDIEGFSSHVGVIHLG